MFQSHLPFTKQIFFFYKMLSGNNKHMPGIHTVPETLKVCCRKFLSKNNIIRRDKKNHYIFWQSFLMTVCKPY